MLASDSEKVDYDALTVAQIQSGIDKYRAALTKARDEVPDEISSDLITSARKNIDTDVDHITAELANQTNDERELRKRLEDQIVASAKSVYGKAVGSDSFNYLLIVFTLVFGVVMVLPRFYPEAVAANILKAEFLLQFSTVFILVAAIIILGIGNLIKNDQLPVLLAGISGYVLGQLGKA